MSDEFQNIITGKICPYSNCETKLVSGDVIYAHIVNDIPRPKFLDKMFYVCIRDPDHYVGTYNDNLRSLGRLADAELRRCKHQGIKIFDPMWKEKKVFKYQKVTYKWLGDKMEIPVEYTHFGMFTEDQCKAAIGFCKDLKSHLK